MFAGYFHLKRAESDSWNKDLNHVSDDLRGNHSVCAYRKKWLDYHVRLLRWFIWICHGWKPRDTLWWNVASLDLCKFTFFFKNKNRTTQCNVCTKVNQWGDLEQKPIQWFVFTKLNGWEALTQKPTQLYVCSKVNRWEGLKENSLHLSPPKSTSG